MQRSRFTVSGFSFKFKGLAFRFEGLWLIVQRFRFWCLGLLAGVLSSGFKCSGVGRPLLLNSGLRIEGLGLRGLSAEFSGEFEVSGFG